MRPPFSDRHGRKTALIGDPGIVMLILSATMILFIWNRWRYDVVAVMALIASLAAGIVPAERAFAGFGHPAVITVAAVLVMSQALQRSGIVDHLANAIASLGRNAWTETMLTASVAASLSAFMNNVGALALMLPVAVRNAERRGLAPSVVLMPLAFASLLGGLVTLIGTPPNIVIAAARAEAAGTPFAMFDFTYAGLPVALTGLAFIALFGRLFLPKRRRRAPAGDRFRLNAYLIETKVLPSSPMIGATIGRLEEICDNEATVMAIIRDGEQHLAPDGDERLAAEDILILQGDPLALQPLLGQRGLISVGDADVKQASLMSDDVILAEAMVMPKAPIEGRSMRRLRMHQTYGVNLLAMARKGQPPEARLANIRSSGSSDDAAENPADAWLPAACRTGLQPAANTNLLAATFDLRSGGSGSRPWSRTGTDRLRCRRSCHGADRRHARARHLCQHRMAGDRPGSYRAHRRQYRIACRRPAALGSHRPGHGHLDAAFRPRPQYADSSPYGAHRA